MSYLNLSMDTFTSEGSCCKFKEGFVKLSNTVIVHNVYID